MDALKVSIKSLLKLHFSLLSTASSSMEIEFPVWNLLPAFFLSAFMNVSKVEREKKMRQLRNAIFFPMRTED